MCTITVNWKDRNVPMCVSMFPSVWRFPWERLSVCIQHLGRCFGQISLAQFWKAEHQQQLNLTKTITEDGSLDVILDVYDGDFCMLRIHSYGKKPFHSEKTQDLYFRKSSSRLRSSSNVSTRGIDVYMDHHPVWVMIKCLLDSFKYMTWFSFYCHGWAKLKFVL